MVGAVLGELVPHVSSTLWLIPALPLAGAAINLFLGERLGRWAGVLATVLVFGSFGVSIAAVLDLLTNASENRLAIEHLFDWISVGGFQVGADLRLDTLSATMILVITGVGALIHLYSIGYMAEDPRRATDSSSGSSATVRSPIIFCACAAPIVPRFGSR